MDKQPNGWLNSYSASDPTMSVPLTSTGSLAAVSPYLNFDPAYINQSMKRSLSANFRTSDELIKFICVNHFNVQHELHKGGSEFIFPEGAARQRGRFELAFSQIGGSVMIGGVFGGVNGLYTGLKETSQSGLTGSVRRTQLLNYITKRGAASANSLGVIAVMYSGFGVILSLVRGTDDELNTVTAATATGLLYKSSAGLRKCAIGGVAGFVLAALYCFWTSRDRLQSVLHSNPA